MKRARGRTLLWCLSCAAMASATKTLRVRGPGLDGMFLACPLRFNEMVAVLFGPTFRQGYELEEDPSMVEATESDATVVYATLEDASKGPGSTLDVRCSTTQAAVKDYIGWTAEVAYRE
ncbi:hypothetical protein KFE25_009427 [Diacronema lutheri]|uniref:Uncharacterized protein n=1 Tax=Diacronema lutheri TaxID=2081491 RepID=A0A8J6CHC3_DIALT|nr:hypothetical protein KFE25_009427 [Diacronema lutheri]